MGTLLAISPALGRCLPGLLVLACGLPAWSQAQAARHQDLTALRQAAAAWLTTQATQAYPDVQARVEIGPVDDRLRLESCASPAFFLPAGARLWSGGSLGVKCVAPAAWSLYLSYQSSLTGPALSLRHAVAARHLLAPGDVEPVRTRYLQDPGQYPRTLPAGATTLRPMAASQALLIQDLHLPEVIQAGALVRVRVNGAGFSVTQEGKALNAAQAGAGVRVRMPGGRVVRGLATAAGEVEVRP